MNKKISCLFLAFVMLLSIAFTDSGAVVADSYDELIVVHTNDAHSRVRSVKDKDGNMTGVGYDRISQYVKDLKKSKNVLFLDAGDTLHGQPIATISRGDSIVSLMNLMSYDAMVPGNHDFNYGYDRLKELEKKMNFPLIAANVTDESGNLVFSPYTVKKVNMMKVGIFGLATPETAYKTNPKNVEKIRFTDPVEAAEKAVADLKKQGCDVIICLAHLGLDEGDYTSDKVALGVKGIDLIVDGHSHTTLPEGRMAGSTLIVSRGEHDKAFGIATLEIEDREVQSKKARLIMAKDAKELDADPAVVEEISSITEEQKKILSEVIGKTSVELEGKREVVRAGESNLGQLVTDAMLDVTQADIALTNGGGIRASIKEGDITKGDILTTFPFGNYLIAKKVKGSAVLEALEHGVSTYPEHNGGFPHVAGMSFTLDPGKKAGERVSEVKVGDSDLEPEKEYILVTNDFMASGGDGYTMLKKAPIVNEYPALDEILIGYIQKSESVSGEFSPRIHIKGQSSAPAEDPASKSSPEASSTNIDEAAPASIAAVVTAEETSALQEEVPAAPSQREAAYHIVAPGDMLWKIAAKHNTTWQRLAKINKIKNPNLIHPGQKIMLP